MLRILLVDDEAATRITVSCALADAGHAVTEAADGAEALLLTEVTSFDVAICDVRLPGVDGLSLLRHFRRESPNTAVILMTAFGRVDDAVAALREGAFDYVTKPFDCEEFTLRTVGRLSERHALRHELETARASLVAREVGCGLVGDSPPMRRLRDAIATAAQGNAHVLVTGEAGVGKKLVARTLHAMSARKRGPLVVADCASEVSERDLGAALFGGGAGDEADDDSPGGWVDAARGGSLVLDNIAYLPKGLQTRLLHRLENEAGEPVGETRVVSLTTRNLEPLVQRGDFRADLYYRLGVVEVAVPSVRHRIGDLPLLLQEFLARLTPPGMVPPGITPRAWSALQRYPFPGNLREFAHAIGHALVLAHGSEIDAEHLPSTMTGGSGTSADAFVPLVPALRRFERQHLAEALRSADGHRARAAELLGISPASLREKLRHHGLTGNALSARPGHRWASVPESSTPCPPSARGQARRHALR